MIFGIRGQNFSFLTQNQVGRTGHGDHRPTIVCLAYHMNSSFFTLPSSLNYAPSSSKKQGHSLPSPTGRGKPRIAARGRGCLFGCWRTGHGDHRPTNSTSLFVPSPKAAKVHNRR